MKLLVSLALLSTVHGSAEHRFYSYPKGLMPLESTIDFSLFNSSTIIPETTKDDVLETYQFATNFLGFVFDGNDTVKFVLAKTATGANFTNDWGSLGEATDPEFTFFEQIPVSNDNQVFMYKFFDFVRHGDVAPKDYHCLAAKSILPTDKTLEEHCRAIPRCMGYIEDECLVSSASRKEPIKTATGKIYFEKKRVHDTIKGISDNFILFWSLYGSTVAVLVAFPTLLSKINSKKEKSNSRIRNIY